MTGDGHAHDAPGSSVDWSDEGPRRTPDSTDATRRRPRSTRRDRPRAPGAGTDRDAGSPGGDPPVDGDDRPRLGRGGQPSDAEAGPWDETVDGSVDVDELEARIHQQRASLQNVVDRYEAIIEAQQSAADGGRRATRREGLLDGARERASRLVTDLRIAIGSRRR